VYYFSYIIVKDRLYILLSIQKPTIYDVYNKYMMQYIICQEGNEHYYYV